MGQLLALPDERQADAHSCGPAVYRCVCRFLGLRVKPPPADPMDGLHPAYLAGCFRRAGLLTRTGDFDVDALRWHTNRGWPVVALVRHLDTGHYVVVGGVSRGRVHFHCPLVGPSRQSVADFTARWHDYDGSGNRFGQWGLAVGLPG